MARSGKSAGEKLKSLVKGKCPTVYAIAEAYFFQLAHILFQSRLRSRILESVSTLSGDLDSAKLSLFSIIKDERFLLPAFLAHHRSLGVEQFAVLVDSSRDGSLEFLLGQKDVVVLESSIKFGDQINVSVLARFGKVKEKRAAWYLKEVLTQELFRKQYGLYLDADEFLFIPPSCSNIQDVIQQMKLRRQFSIAASVVEFFPESIVKLRAGPLEPRSLADLLEQSPYFENVPVLSIEKGRFPKRVRTTKSGELFARHLGVRDKGGTTLKTPIVRHSWFSFRRGSHLASLPPASYSLLTIGHFIFNSQCDAKINEAIKARTHYSPEKYELLGSLLEQMAEDSASFLSDNSERFESPSQFLPSKLMIWANWV